MLADLRPPTRIHMQVLEWKQYDTDPVTVGVPARTQLPEGPATAGNGCEGHRGALSGRRRGSEEWVTFEGWLRF